MARFLKQTGNMSNINGVKRSDRIGCRRARLGIRLLLLLSLFFPFLAMAEEEEIFEFFPEDAPRTGDIDQLLEERIIRALVVHNKMFYFLDKGRQRGSSYELLKEFEKFVNKKQKSKTLGIHVVFIPVPRDRLLPDLKAGRGDIAVANLTITDERSEQVDFSRPVISGISEVLVTGPTAPEINSVDELSGEIIHVRPSSSYHEHLTKLNERLRQQGKAPVGILPVNEYLEDEDLLEMVNAGLIPMIIVDSHKAEFWAGIFENIKVHPQIAINENGSIAWAFRRNSPGLKALVDEFIAKHKKGTLFGNIIYKRYLKSNKWARNNLNQKEIDKFNKVVGLFQKYSRQYSFDHLMIVALAYQESQLDQRKKSPVGAVGIMQMLPSTAADKNVGIPDITDLEKNIHAGIKYLRFLHDRYFSDESIEPLDRILLTFAAYNAGPAKIARLRKEAGKKGLDPNVWFKNVEVVAARRIGRETVQYVSNIYKYYTAYRMLKQGEAVKNSLKSEPK